MAWVLKPRLTTKAKGNRDQGKETEINKLRVNFNKIVP